MKIEPRNESELSINRREIVGIIGLGAMGRELAIRLDGAGFPVVAYDVRPDAAHGLPVRTVGSAQEVGDVAGTVLDCLPTLESYRDSVLGAHGLVKGRAARRYVHVGTTGADLVREIASVLGDRIVTVDAPVTGGVPRAKRGELTVIASGSTAEIVDLAPLFASYCNRTIQVSDRIGDAQTVKLINNVLSAANLAMACEALTLGTHQGIAPEKIIEVVNNGTGQSDASLTKIPRHVLTRTFDYGGSLRISLKDIGQYHLETLRTGVANHIATAVKDVYFAAADHGHAESDMAAVALYLEDVSSTPLNQS